MTTRAEVKTEYAKTKKIKLLNFKVSEGLYIEAHRLGIHISRTCRDALILEVERVRKICKNPRKKKEK